MNRTFRRIIGCNIKFPKVFSQECIDIITALLKVRANRRLGILKGGAELIRKHSWFSRFRWEILRKKEMKAPFKLKVRGYDDISNFTSPGEEQNTLYKFNASDYDMMILVTLHRPEKNRIRCISS